jgi:hypothetical protein
MNISSYRIRVTLRNGEVTDNKLRFETPEEAKTYGEAVQRYWTAVTSFTVEGTTDRINSKASPNGTVTNL